MTQADADPVASLAASRFLPRSIAALVGALALVMFSASSTLAARSTAFSASCAGHALVHVNGVTGSASATGTCRGTLVGKSTFSGAATGDTSNPPCVPFSGSGVIRSKAGTIMLAALPGARACAAGAGNLNNVSFSGTAKVTGGTARFKNAGGTVSFSGHYHGQSGVISITLKGNVILQ